MEFQWGAGRPQPKEAVEFPENISSKDNQVQGRNKYFSPLLPLISTGENSFAQ
jgi:hypothetical protein